MIRREERDDGLVVLRLEHGKANALDLELGEALGDQMDALRHERPSPAVVLGASGPIFSAGVDLFRILEEDGTYIDRFLPALSRMLVGVGGHPRPVVAALGGHAVAGGCVLACACDLRLMAEGAGTVGLPELRVGVPLPHLALEIVRAAVPAGRVRELVYGGETYGPWEALERGLVDEVVAPERLLHRACERARELAAIPEDAFALTKRQLRRPFLAAGTDAAAGPDAATGTDAAVEVDAEALRCWKAPEARKAIAAYLERTLGRSRRTP